MLSLRSRRRAALLSVVALATTSAVAAAPAQAGLLGGLITDTGQTLGNLLPGVGGVVTTVTGTVGGGGVVGGGVGGVEDSVTGDLLSGTLGGVTGGGGGATTDLLPVDALTPLLGSVLGSGTPGFGGVGGPIVLSGGKVTPGGAIVDAAAPRPSVRVLSKLRSIGRTGRMRLQVVTDEPGIVALTGNVRPGQAVGTRKARGSAVQHSRKLIKVPSMVLGYRRAGKLVVTVKLSRAAQRTLGRSRNARISVGTVAADLFRNQDADRSKLTIKR